MTLTKGNKKTVNKVVKGLKKASKLHAKQAGTLNKMVRSSKKKVQIRGAEHIPNGVEPHRGTT